MVKRIRREKSMLLALGLIGSPLAGLEAKRFGAGVGRPLAINPKVLTDAQNGTLQHAMLREQKTAEYNLTFFVTEFDCFFFFIASALCNVRGESF